MAQTPCVPGTKPRRVFEARLESFPARQGFRFPIRRENGQPGGWGLRLFSGSTVQRSLAMAAAKPASRKKRPGRRTATPGSDTALRDGIVEAALAVAEAALAVAEDWGWYDLRLHHVAERLNLPLAAIRAEFRDGDAIADAWIARADAAMLAGRPRRFAALPPPERLQIA